MSIHFHGRISKLTMHFHEQYLPPQGKEIGDRALPTLAASTFPYLHTSTFSHLSFPRDSAANHTAAAPTASAAKRGAETLSFFIESLPFDCEFYPLAQQAEI